MSFVYPAFLFGLFSLLIPILIHLFNFRKYKRVAFSNVRFLREVKEQTKAQSELKHLLVLISRLVALTFLVLAFAQPYLVGDAQTSKSGKSAVSIYLDNSFSMNAVSEEGDLFDIGRQFAHNITDGFSDADDFQFLTNSFSGEQQRLYNKEGVHELIQKASQTPEFRDIQTIVNRQVDALSESEADNKRIFIVSDGQTRMFDQPLSISDSSINISLVSLEPNPINNLFIDSCWFTSPVRMVGQTDELMVRIKNLGDEAMTAIPVKLFINDQQKSIASINLGPSETTITPLSFTANKTGQILGKVEITDYPITFDDQYYFQYELQPSLRILHIYGKDSSTVLHNLFKTDPYFKLVQQKENEIDYGLLDKQNFIILSGLQDLPSALVLNLTKFNNNGGGILFFPRAKEGDANSLNLLGLPSFSKWNSQPNPVSSLSYDHPLFNNVFEERSAQIDLPVANQYFEVSTASQTGLKPIMGFANGQLFLGEVTTNQGGVFFCASPLLDSASSFYKHALLLPTVFQMVLGSNQTQEISQTIGENQSIRVRAAENSTESVVHLTNQNGTIDIIPEVRKNGSYWTLNFFDQVKESGNYLLKVGNKTFSGVAFNYNRKESVLSFQSAETLVDELKRQGNKNVSVLAEKLDRVTGSLKTATSGTPLWQVCLLLAFLFFVIEIALLRLLP